MSTSTESMDIDLPVLPASHEHFISYIAAHKSESLRDLTEPFKKYDAEMRKIFAQKPNHPAVQQPSVVPVFAGHHHDLQIRARNLDGESEEEQQAYIMPLRTQDRKPDASPAVAQSLQEFQTNFSVFSELSLAELDWSNVVAAGSAVVTSLLPVPKKHAESKRALRKYYHEELAPASDVDLFLYGLTEEQAVEKIKQIEKSIRDAILTEVTTVRTKNAITIVSQYPTRHVQIVLRLYRSVSEILTGFDVDSSCVAYDGKQVYASPRALTSFITQTNDIDLSRRSPSYENRLSKYAHRGFEVYWPLLDRARIDPTIFERSFTRSEGLARLLILEKLPKTTDRQDYASRRREERGRPQLNQYYLMRQTLKGNIKADHEDEIGEWVDGEDVSNYHTFTIPYGLKFNARKIERLLYTKDLLLNAEWNIPKDREVHLHRHPAFFGKAEDALGDCCGYCPEPKTVEEKEVAEKENKIYISGPITFIKDDPGRQMIGSFNPLSPEDWTDMAYVGNTERLCQSIVDHDAEYVRTWLEQDGNDPNVRDYTGRAPLHLAVTDSTSEIVQLLIDHGSRLVARLADGRTALHLAAIRGDVEIIKAILSKSEANEEEELKKQEAARAVKGAKSAPTSSKDALLKDKDNSDEEDEDDSDSDISMIDSQDQDQSEPMDSVSESSFVRVKRQVSEQDKDALESEEDKDEPDVYDINVLAWDTAVSPLHLAIVNGNIEAVKCLVQDFGADVLLPIKLLNDWDRSAKAAILTLVLALHLPDESAAEMAQCLLQLGASFAQGDLSRTTGLHYAIAMRPDLISFIERHDKTGFMRAINHVPNGGYNRNTMTPLDTALDNCDKQAVLFLLHHGATFHVDFGSWLKVIDVKHGQNEDFHKSHFNRYAQPIIRAVQNELPTVAKALIEEFEVDVNVVHNTTRWVYEGGRGTTIGPFSLLDEVRLKIGELENWNPRKDFPRSLSHHWSPVARFGRTQYPEVQQPAALQVDESYLGQFKPGSYARWFAERQLDAAKAKHRAQTQEYEDLQRWLRDNPEQLEKQAAIAELRKLYEELETVLLRKGAKPIDELDPKKTAMPKNIQQLLNAEEPEKESEPFAVDFGFTVHTFADEVKSRYIALFNAAWTGDSQRVKELTLVPWKDSKDIQQPPLQIAVQDWAGFSPFAIAVLRGHHDLASTILNIACVQFKPEDSEKKRRYGLQGTEESDDESSGEEDEGLFAIYSEIVDEQFTIETIGEVSLHVKSSVSALAMLKWGCHENWLDRRGSSSSGESGSGRNYLSATEIAPSTKENSEDYFSNPHTSRRSLIGFSIRENDLALLQYLLSRAEELTSAAAKSDDEDAQRFYAATSGDLENALESDRPHILAELIRRTGAGLPLTMLVKGSGIEVPTAPNFYKGLSVYGKKRTDWAKKAARQDRFDDADSWQPPLLLAAEAGSLEVVEWLLGGAPLRCYQEFASDNAEDKQVKLLEASSGRFEGATERYLNTRSHLALHHCLMCRPIDKSVPLLRLLVGAMPENLDARSHERLTPLLVAFRLHLAEHAKILIAAGADQTARDASGNNIVHQLVKHVLDNDSLVKNLHNMLNLIDKRLLPELMTERSSENPGSSTPLALLLQNANLEEKTVRAVTVLKVLMQYSSGSELQMINGAGHTPIHVAVSGTSGFPIAQALLQHDPNLLFRENTVGRTPLDIIEDTLTACHCRELPSLQRPRHHPFARNANYGFVRRGNRYRQNLVDVPLQAFAKLDPTHDPRNTFMKLRDLLHNTKKQVIASQGVAKRRLVSLNEANEVAKRLALFHGNNQIRAPRNEESLEADAEEDGTDHKVVQDQVEQWLRVHGTIWG